MALPEHIAALRLQLNPAQQKFAEVYSETGNATRAAREAGYSAHSAPSSGSRLAKNDKVAQYIQHLREESSNRATLSRQRKRELLAMIAEGVLPGDRLGAIKVDNQMAGDDAPIRVSSEDPFALLLANLPPTRGLPSES